MSGVCGVGIADMTMCVRVCVCDREGIMMIRVVDPLIAYFGGMCVGAICCRPEMDGTRIYIMTLGVLAPYRHLGLGNHRCEGVCLYSMLTDPALFTTGSQLLTHVLQHASRVPRFTYIYLHVQITNQAALTFYQKHGFHIIGMEKNYYRDIEPRDAYILRRINIPSPSH